MSWIDRLATVVTDHSRIVVVVLLLVTAGLAPGIGAIEESSSISVSDETAASEAYGEVQATFSADGANTTRTMVAIRNEEGNVLSKESLVRTLRYQHALHTDETLEPTLVDENPTIGVENIVARAAIAAESNATEAGSPTIDEQLEQLESMNESAVTAVVERVLDPERSTVASRRASELLPQTYEPGSTTADARLILVTQETGGDVQAAAEIPSDVSDGQRAARSIATDQAGPETYHVFSRGLVNHQQGIAVEDSLAIVGPLAVLFVLVSLSLAYRDPIDVVLGLVGVGVVLLWTLGLMGWLGIEFSQVMIAVPILLVGLSVDYALHVVVRYREERIREDDEPRDAMRRALIGVGPALTLVTISTAIGFLANLVRPLGDIQSFGIVTAIGITATLAVFGLLVPALKSESATYLERYGWDCTPSVPGSSDRLQRVLGGGASIARRAPVLLLVVTLLVSVGAAYGATGVEVSASQEPFMADDPPEWTATLPEAVQPSEFYLKENRRYLYSEFQSPDTQGYVLVDGNVTAPGTLERVAAAHRSVAASDAVFVSSSGEPEIVTPLSAMERTADRNRTFDETFHAADTDGDGVPDRHLETVYDAFYATAPELATRTVSRTDGEYTALRLRIATDGNVNWANAAAPVADAADELDGDERRAIATGQPVIEAELNDRLAATMLESIASTLVVIFLLLLTVFRLREGSASLGAVTLVPVTVSVTWLLGTMALLNIPISVITALVGSIAVGLGVDYAIHVSERYGQERRKGATVEAALSRTVTGTGSALLSSAVTTAAGFGILSFSLLPGLRQFGIVLAVGIVYAFVSTVYVQPSLLVLWDRYRSASTTPAESSVAVGDD